MSKAALYPTLWRWHFYAGLFVIPFVMILSITGAIYLFKPQLDVWQDSDRRNLSSANIVSVDTQFNAMRAAYPKAIFHHYKLPVQKNDAAIFHVALKEGVMRDVYVSPQGEIIATVNPDDRISAFVSKIHGTLLLGSFGRYLVELAASWAIIMIITGLYLWWPRGRKYAGILWPRLKAGKKLFWRDIHAVTGFYISGLVMILLLSGLPWTQVWSSGFNMVRAEMDWVNNVEQDWKSSKQNNMLTVNQLHLEHDHKAMLEAQNDAEFSSIILANMTDEKVISFASLESAARSQNLIFPIIIKPQKPIKNDSEIKSQNWKISSLTQNRPLRGSITVNNDADLIEKQDFSDRHIIDQIISYGIAWHEGQLLGWFNQLIGLLTAIALLVMSISGIKIWWQRRASNMTQSGANFLSAPPKTKLQSKAAIIIIIICALLLPMIALSILPILILDYLIFRRFDSV